MLGNFIAVHIGNSKIALSKSCSIDVKCDDIEVSSPSTGTWKTFITKRKEWSVSVNYLVGGSLQASLNVGAAVTLNIVPEFNTTYTFAGVTADVYSNSRTIDPTAIYYHATAKRFVALGTDDNYYTAWAYTGSDGESYFIYPVKNVAYYDSSSENIYTWNGEELVQFRGLSGAAICTQCQIDAAWGALAKGSFKFKGNGALTLVSEF